MAKLKHGGSRPKVRDDDKRGGARKGAGPKPKQISLKLGSQVQIEINGTLRQYEVVAVAPHLRLRKAE